MRQGGDVVLLPDAGPLITLAYADALDVLFKPGWSVALVDMVLHEVTRSETPTSEKLARWAKDRRLPVLPTKTFRRYKRLLAATTTALRKADLGELAVQEIMSTLALDDRPRTVVFLFEDHKIARANFLVPANCRKISTRAYLLFLEEQGYLESAAAIERRAVQAGRAFSALRFPTA